MSFTDEYLNQQKKKKKKNEEKTTAAKTKKSGNSFTDEYLSSREKSQVLGKEVDTDDIAPVKPGMFKTQNIVSGKVDIAPVKDEEEKEERTWFQKSSYFDDGYDFGDVTRTILGTTRDIGENLSAGILGMGEKVVDALAYLAPAAARSQFIQSGGYYNQQAQKVFDETQEEAKKGVQEFIKKDLYDEEAIAKKIVLGTDRGSVLGEKTGSLVQSGGQLLATAGLQAVGVPWFVTMGTTSFGGEAENALNQGATYEEAGLSAAISAGAEILSEKLSGGISFGGKTWDDAIMQKLSRGISNKLVRSLSRVGLDMAGEGAEEIVSQVASNLGSSLYREESLGDLLFSEEAVDGYIESFIGGAALGGFGGVKNAIRANRQGIDAASGLTASEEAVVKKVYEDRISEAEESGKLTEKEKAKIYNEVLKDVEKGYVSVDTIEEVLGGETYQTYKNTVESEDAIRSEFDTLNKLKQSDMTGEQMDRRTELKAQIEDMKQNSRRDSLKYQLGDEVFGLVQGSKLAESYNQRSLRGEVFTADLTQYDEAQQEVVKRAADSGILNNTRRTHEFVDVIAKISADKGVLFDFTNNEKLKESGFAVQDRTVDGFVTGDGITLNMDSPKAWQTTVGHEVTHVLEGTELYDALRQTVFDYAKSRGEYDSKLADIQTRYANIESADFASELTSDLVGEYLFTDADFVKHLSTSNRNVFQKVYNEIKYLYKVVTAGSKEARQLEKVKRAFEEAYRESGKAVKTNAEDLYDVSAKYSVRVTDKDTLDFLDNQETVKTYKTMQLVDGKLYPPMASRINGKFEDASELGTWEQATEHPELIKDGNKFKLDKGKGQGSIEAAYNPYMHSSNLVLNDQFSGAYKRDNLVTVECEVPVSELTSGYQAEFAKDAVGWHPWHTGTVAGQLRNAKGTERQVLLSRWIKPVRIVPDSEVAAKYKELLDGTNIEVPDNVVTPSLLNELKNAGVKVKESGRVKYSVSDSDGKQLSKGQQDYFQDSKMRDENGNLKVMYHGSQDAGFHVFDPARSDDGISLFFVDSNDVASSYSGSTEEYAARTIRTAQDMNNFLAEIGENDDYSVVEKDGKFELYQDGDFIVGTETAQALYEEFCDWAGVGYGDANYKVYLNLKNPLEVDAEGRNWDNVSKEFSQELYDVYNSFTEEEKAALKDLVEWGDYALFKDEIRESLRRKQRGDADPHSEPLATAMEKTWDESTLFDLASNDFSEEIIRERAVKNLKTRDYAKLAKEQGYDGVIFKNIVDLGQYGGDYNSPHTVAIAFDSNQVKSVANAAPSEAEDIRYSMSGENTQQKGTPLRDLRLETAPAEEAIAPVQESATVAEDLFPDNYAPTEEEVTQRQSDRLYSLDDTDAPPETEAPYQTSQETEVDDPFEDRDWYEVGNRKIKAYMYENPEVRPFFQAEAKVLKQELSDTIKGERWYNDQLYYDSGGESGWGGTKRFTSDSIAEMLDSWGMSYADIEKGLDAIIEDHGAENIAAAKKIEFMINSRLMEGYKDFYSGQQAPANQDYLNLLNEKQVTEYSREAFDAFMANADQYAPPAVEDIGPVAPTAPKPTAQPVIRKPAGDDIAPTFEVRTDRRGNIPGQQAMTQEDARSGNVANVLVDEPTAEKKSGMWGKLKNLVLDKGMVFEDLSLRTGNRELQARWNSIRYARNKAQRVMEMGNASISSLDSIRKAVEGKGKEYTKNFYNYLYHLHNVDRMSLETEENRIKRESLAGQFQGYTDKQLNDLATSWITKDTTPDAAARIKAAREYVEARQQGNKPVFGYDVTADVSRETVNRLEKANPEFKEYAQEVYGYMNYLRQEMVDAGVISSETAKLWADMYPHYVPIRRAGDFGLSINVPLDTGRTGVNAPIKRATGGSRDILPLFDTMGQRTMQTYSAIAKNRFGVELKDTLGTTIGSEAVGLDEAINSIDTHDGLLQEGKNGQKPTFTVFEDGKRVTFEITEEMYDAMKPTSDALSYTNKAVNTIGNIRRGTLTEYNPWFMLKNAIKDTQDVLINSQHPARTYAAVPKAISQMLTNGHWYSEYMENGGEQNSYFDSQTNTFTKPNKTVETIKKYTGLELIAKANNVIERLPRLAEYIASRDAGRSVDVAMLDSARVTTNFAAGGDLTKFANRNGATFLNASVQGAVQQVRNVREAKANGVKGMLGLAAKFAVAGVPSVILNNLVWDDDEEYDELSDYVKQNYYIVGKYGDGKFVRIPKGRTVAVIQNGLEQMQNLVTGDDEADMGTFLDLLLTNLAPNNPFDNNILSPVLQVAQNKTWYGEDLIPTRLQDLPDAEQYDESTDALSRWLGEKLDYSPVKVNYLLDQYSGVIGDTFLPMLTPEAESGDESFLGGMIAPLRDMFTTDSVLNNQNVSDFYDTKDELTKAGNSMNATDDDVLSSKYMAAVNAEMGKLYGEKRKLQSDMLLSDAEKYEAVREVQRQIDELAESSLATYGDISYEEFDGDRYANVGDKYWKYDTENGWSKLDEDAKTKYLVTSAAGEGAVYATNGEVSYYWHTPGEDAKDQTPYWKKVTADQLEKQEEVTDGLGITPEEYWENKEEYEFAYENPGKYAISKSVGGYESYTAYKDELNDFSADKDENGKSISGSKKEKVYNYVFGLDIEYGQKAILFRSMYDSKADKAEYNYDIVEYLNSREDITYEEMVDILKELDMTVSSDGKVTW